MFQIGLARRDWSTPHSYVGFKLPCLHVATAVQLIHRQRDNENNRKIMPKCIYLRNRKESKSRQSDHGQEGAEPPGWRRCCNLVGWIIGGEMTSVRCCKSQVHLLKFENVIGNVK